jgi:pyruvate,water dikinase
MHSLWHTEMKSHIKRGVWCVLGSVTHSADYTLQLRRRLSELVGSQDANILIANLSNENELLESLGPLAGLHKLARGEISRDAYLAAYGHRGPDEFELSQPRPAEDPAWLDQELEKINRADIDLESLLGKQRQSHKAAWLRLQERTPWAAARFSRQLAESASRARIRELARSAYTRDRWVIRLFALRAGEMTGLEDQVFFLTLDELLALLSGNPSVTQVIESRLNTYQRYKDLPPYPSVIRGAFDPFDWAADPSHPTDILDAHQHSLGKSTLTSVRGSPGSAGIVEGLVRIIDHPDKGSLLRQGEILVAQQTDIAWTLLFPRAAGIITDIGAPLSHAAIVARELGIPAVVGCGNATALLKTGDRVRIDGAQGTVELISTVHPQEV